MKTELTATQKKFFSKPRTMRDIMDTLFNGDAWAANNFQNEQISAGNLETVLIGNVLHIQKKETKLYKVVKVFRVSQRRQILERDLTEAEAQRVVKGYPNSSRSMVIYTAQ